jgi:RNA 2',3'-cyclic 3'-phosphodiesterase
MFSAAIESPRRPLYVMIKPPAEIAQLIWRLPLTSRSRGVELLHATMLPLGDRLALDAATLAGAMAALGTMAAARFRIVFDRMEAARDKVVLNGSEPIRGALRFQDRLHEALRGAGLAVPRRTIRPHITLDYRWSGPPGSAPIDPISWQVGDYVLIESVYGQGRHIEHGRWALRD